MSADLLVPSYSSIERQSTLTVATFNLVATIVGGGVLSLPLAFEKCGIILASLLMLLAAATTDRSLWLLCLSARISGASSYGEIGKASFGDWMEGAISLLLFVFLLFVLVAYMVLVKDIWTPLVGMLVEGVHGDVVLLLILIFMTPFLLQRTLHALRFNCYVGFASVSLLCLALCHHGLTSPHLKFDLKLWPEKMADVLFAFPIITLSFLSHFNILPIQSALVEPSRYRINATIHCAVASCFVLMYLFGLGGYMYAGDATQGNILLNTSVDTTDWMLFLGRVGCGITIMLALPIMLLPCRGSILQVVDACSVSRGISEETPLLASHNDNLSLNPVVHVGSTLAIVVVTYLGAVLAPGVAIVWSLCGSTMAFLISFILPAACYLQIDKMGSYRVFSMVLLAFAISGAASCTIQTTIGILDGSSI
jgi:amino acid permease